MQFCCYSSSLIDLHIDTYKNKIYFSLNKLKKKNLTTCVPILKNKICILGPAIV